MGTGKVLDYLWRARKATGQIDKKYFSESAVPEELLEVPYSTTLYLTIKYLINLQPFSRGVRFILILSAYVTSTHAN